MLAYEKLSFLHDTPSAFIIMFTAIVVSDSCVDCEIPRTSIIRVMCFDFLFFA